jgi:hypothetical protein
MDQPVQMIKGYTLIRTYPEADSNFTKYICRSTTNASEKQCVIAMEYKGGPNATKLRRTVEFIDNASIEITSCIVEQVTTWLDSSAEYRIIFRRPIGKTLGELKAKCGGTIPPRLIREIAAAGFRILKQVHDSGIALRNINLDTFCYHPSDGLFLVDASYYKRVIRRDSSKRRWQRGYFGKHIVKRRRDLHMAMFKTKGVWLKQELVRRDDFEAFLHLLYFLAYDERLDTSREIGKCNNSVMDFSKFFKIAREIKFTQAPDYGYILSSTPLITADLSGLLHVFTLFWPILVIAFLICRKAFM